MKDSLMTKISFGMLGVFILVTIFAITIEFLETKGVWLGLILSLIISATGFYFTEKGDKLRITIWTLLITLLLTTSAFITIVQLMLS